MASLLVSCRDCGHSKVWFPARTRHLRSQPNLTVSTLAGKLFCQPCRDQGGEGKSITMEGFPTLPEKAKFARPQKLIRTHLCHAHAAEVL